MNIIKPEKINCLKMYCKKIELLKTSKYLFFVFLFTTFENSSFSQEQRLTDDNSIGWLVYTGTFKIKSKIVIHTEYQWRRVDGIKNWQQCLFRTGVNYAVRKDVSLNAGYAFTQTFPYGDYPGIAAFPEHRIYEQVILSLPGSLGEDPRRNKQKKLFPSTLKFSSPKIFPLSYISHFPLPLFLS